MQQRRATHHQHRAGLKHCVPSEVMTNCPCQLGSALTEQCTTSIPRTGNLTFHSGEHLFAGVEEENPWTQPAGPSSSNSSKSSSAPQGDKRTAAEANHGGGFSVGIHGMLAYAIHTHTYVDEYLICHIQAHQNSRHQLSQAETAQGLCSIAWTRLQTLFMVSLTSLS